MAIASGNPVLGGGPGLISGSSGGTGTSSLTANAVIIGNGTHGLKASTWTLNGSVLTGPNLGAISDGPTWLTLTAAGNASVLMGVIAPATTACFVFPFDSLIGEAGATLVFAPAGGPASMIIDDSGSVGISGTFTSINGLTLVGTGVLARVASGRVTGKTSATATIVTYLPNFTASFIISPNVNVLSGTSFSFTMTCAYTDENSVFRTLTLSFSQLAGTSVQTITNVTGTGPYEGTSVRIRALVGSSITIQTVGTFVAVNYSAEASIVIDN